MSGITTARLPAGTDVAPVERQVVVDMCRRALPVLPLLVAGAGIIWGVDGALSAAFAIALVLMNFMLSASLLAWAARISLVVLLVTAMVGFVARLALITAIVLLLKDQDWMSIVPLGLTLIVTHLGLLIWETRHVSASLAFPALKPKAG